MAPPAVMQPDLVAVPDGPDGVDQDAAFAVVAAEYRQQDADAEVEAFEDEVAGQQDGDRAGTRGGAGSTAVLRDQ